MKKYVSCFLLAFICAIAECGVDEEPCPQFPARYELDFMIDDLRIDLAHEVVDGELIPLDIDIDSLNALIFTQADFDEFTQEFFSAITLIDEQTAEFSFPDFDGAIQSQAFPYSLRSGQFYTVDVGGGDILIIEVADDCSYIDYCAGGAFVSFSGDFLEDNFISTDNPFCEGRSIEEFLPTGTDLTRYEDGTHIAVNYLSVRFLLQND